MTYIKAPYNFVPLNKDVVTPYWAPYISHDVPFEDSHSGTLEVTITAHSSIFVKDGLGKKEAASYFDDKNAQIQPFRFNQDRQGNFFIPGSSIKGMLRNVLEILSFGGMERKVTERKYSLRDLSSSMKAKYLENFKPDKIYGGWLRKTDNNEYVIKDCGLPGRVSHRQIDEKLGSNLSDYYSDDKKFNPKKDEEKSAQKKYKLFGDRDRFHGFEFDHDSAGRQVYLIDERSNKKGTLVFTGQPGLRKQVRDRGTGEMKWTGHHMEFIFWEINTERLVPKGVISDFFDAYYEYDKTEWSEDWKVWRKKLNEKEAIPVFFSKDEQGNISHLGLSYLYKLPYENSVKESIQKCQSQADIDLSEAIFGYLNKEDSGLKGRVHIGHAFASNHPQEHNEEKQEVLAGPKASYYPNYIRQEIRRDGIVTRYSTFMDGKPEISGWKRYPVHANGLKSNPAPKDNKKILTRFIPLQAGAQFRFKIRYHNLKKIELGALLSALTFHDTEAFHSLGMAKPLGYGKVKLHIDKEVEHKDECLKAFECYMNWELRNSNPEWHISDQVVELVTMAQVQDNSSPSAILEYMKLGMNQEDNAFTKAKSNNEALDKYSNLVKNRASIRPLSTPECIAEMKQQCENEERKLKSLKSLDKLIPDYLIEIEKAIKSRLEEKKSLLQKELQEKRAALSAKEEAQREQVETENREARKRERQEKAKAEGLLLDSVDEHHKNAFDHLKKVVQEYGRDFHMANDKSLKENFPEGFLPESDYATLYLKVQGIFAKLSKSESAKWILPLDKNATLKKVAEWIGEEKASTLLDKFKNR